MVGKIDPIMAKIGRLSLAIQVIKMKRLYIRV